MFDGLNNYTGPLQDDILGRLRAYDGTEERWRDVHSIILRADTITLTVWQAIKAVDPDFPMVGPVGSSPWSYVPSVHTFYRAIRFARTRERRQVS